MPIFFQEQETEQYKEGVSRNGKPVSLSVGMGEIRCVSNNDDNTRTLGLKLIVHGVGTLLLDRNELQMLKNSKSFNVVIMDENTEEQIKKKLEAIEMLRNTTGQPDSHEANNDS